MLRCAIFLLVLCILSGPQIFCEDEKPPLDIPIYPGADVTMEVNLAQQDILPMLEATLPLLGTGLGKSETELKPEDIAAILADVRKIEFVQLEIASKKVTLAQVVAFYSKTLPDGTWKRVFYNTFEDSGTIAVFHDSDSDAYYGFQIRPAVSGTKPTKQVTAAKIVGKIKFAALFKLAGQVVQSAIINSK